MKLGNFSLSGQAGTRVFPGDFFLNFSFLSTEKYLREKGIEGKSLHNKKFKTLTRAIMNINNIGINQATQIQSLQTSKTATGTQGASETGTPAFSSMMPGVDGTSESSNVVSERTEKIAALKEQVQSGNYSPDAQKVAQSMMQFVGSADTLFE
jgi:anti-sigma28 factor (negative regulator of flagellin synthesis)